ncbi:hypothetical protein MFM001_28650 [Mycobacterium sp. MFM001]|uniref:hypothetical protein n=1 Tax=Mycobacterium sp. MFM001 TaxID=2049453 RepID=UPI000DA54649|nr:hypothetical protein MFM001_28650 [Mycobacterium sp. MFM001]
MGAEELPLSLSQIENVTADIRTLHAAADFWNSTASKWEEAFSAVHQQIQRPGGTYWEGTAADAALNNRAAPDLVKVQGLATQLRNAATIARTGTGDLYDAQQRALTEIDKARAAGFNVSEDLTVTSRQTGGDAFDATLRQAHAQAWESNIRTLAGRVGTVQQGIADKLPSATAGVRGVSFTESPIFAGGPVPQEPPPPPVPMPPYQPKVWAACRARGQDPGKVVRTFYHAPISAGFRSMPLGDSVLYCGNDKYGMLHIQKEHGAQWQQIADSGFPGGGNWRYLADYSIGAALAYPERVEYNQNNDTFALYRKISRADGSYAFTVRVVISASDGKIITAFPTTKG